jgi:uncharacterized protein (DUF1697 family)
MLRGVNVGGKKMPMAELRELCASLKLKNVQTYIQSGNVVLDYQGTAARLEELLEKGIEKRFGMSVKVVVRTASELASAIEANPFGDGAYIVFLALKPGEVQLEAINKVKSGKEEFKIAGREVYLLLPEGYGKTKLTNNFFESKLKVAATTRNLRTATILLEMARARRD